MKGPHVEVWPVNCAEEVVVEVSEVAHEMNAQRHGCLQHRRMTKIVNENGIEIAKMNGTETDICLIYDEGRHVYPGRWQTWPWKMMRKD